MLDFNSDERWLMSKVISFLRKKVYTAVDNFKNGLLTSFIYIFNLLLILFHSFYLFIAEENGIIRSLPTVGPH